MTPTAIKESYQLNENFNLQFLARQPKGQPVRTKAIMLLHGVGSNEKDLFSLSAQLPDDFLVISPRGPYILGEGRFAWYEVDFSTGKPVIKAKQEEQSRNILIDFIAQIKNVYAIDVLYVGGFSQGGIMSYSIGLTRPDLVKGILSLSGRILTEIKPFVHKNKTLRQLRVFIAHGVQDSTLAVSYAREAKVYLQELGVQLSYHEYELGHQINGEELHDLAAWLKEDIVN